ncbi:MAG: hypothetical protein EOM69_08420, partial [Clostridia bacterium]|nr:hypothetical protein [Clostridia bacterium]
MAKDNQTLLSRIYHRYLIDAMGAMALGLFSSLIIGLIIAQLAKLPGLAFLAPLTEVLGAASPVIGAAIGIAIAYGLKTDGLAPGFWTLQLWLKRTVPAPANSVPFTILPSPWR